MTRLENLPERVQNHGQQAIQSTLKLGPSVKPIGKSLMDKFVTAPFRCEDFLGTELKS
jgi:hypothetical protein